MKSAYAKVARRDFLKKLILVGASSEILLTGEKVGLQGKKTKMLTPDGLLVEIDESLIKKEVVKGRATNQEVLVWMHDNKNKSKSSGEK